LAPFHPMFHRPVADPCRKKIPHDSGDGRCFDLDCSRDVVGKVCHYRPDTDKTEDARGRGFLRSYLGRVVDPGGLHLSLHAALCPVYKGLSYRSDMGSQRG